MSRDVSALYIPKVGNSPRTKYKEIIAVNASTLKTYKYLVNKWR